MYKSGVGVLVVENIDEIVVVGGLCTSGHVLDFPNFGERQRLPPVLRVPGLPWLALV